MIAAFCVRCVLSARIHHYGRSQITVLTRTLHAGVRRLLLGGFVDSPVSVGRSLLAPLVTVTQVPAASLEALNQAMGPTPAEAGAVSSKKLTCFC